MTIKTVKVALGADLATNGTFTVSYPAGHTAGDFKGGTNFKLSLANTLFSVPKDMTLAFGATAVTVTYLGATTIPAGTTGYFQFDATGAGAIKRDAASGARLYTALQVGLVNLGSPGAAAANGYYLSGAITAADPITTMTGALGATADAPTGRNVVAAWTGTAVMTVTGTDMFGKKLVESSASGTSFTGKKAFKTITSIAVSADVTAATVGTGNVLGLPIFLSSASDVLKELQDNAAATAGTIATGLSIETASTATTADVRGTYTPNSAPDGSKAYNLTVVVKDDGFLGNSQYAG